MLSQMDPTSKIECEPNIKKLYKDLADDEASFIGINESIEFYGAIKVDFSKYKKKSSM